MSDTAVMRDPWETDESEDVALDPWETEAPASPVMNDTQSVPTEETPMIEPDIVTKTRQVPYKQGDTAYDPVLGRDVEVDLRGLEGLGVPTKTEEYQVNVNNSAELIKSMLDEKGRMSAEAYTGLTYEQSVKAYETVANDPESKIINGALTYKGNQVLFPEPGFLNNNPSSSSVAMKKIAAAPFNVAQKVVSVSDYLTGRNDSDALNVPPIVDDRVMSTIGGDVVPMAVGGGVGLKAANEGIAVLSKVLPELPTWLGTSAKALSQSLVRAGGVNAGSIAPVDEDSSGFLAGKDSLTGGMDMQAALLPMEQLANETGGGETLKKSLNLGFDSLFTGGAVSLATRAAAGAFGMAYRVFSGAKAYGSKEYIEAQVAKDRMRSWGWDVDAHTAEETAEMSKRAIQLVEEGKDVKVGEFGAELDPMSAMQRGLEKRPQGEEAISGISNATLGKTVQNSRDEVFNTKMPAPNLKQEEYTDTVENFRKDQYEKGGGDVGVEGSRTDLLDSANRDKLDLEQATQRANTDVQVADDQLSNQIRTDPLIAEDVKRLQDKTKVDILSEGNVKANTVTDQAQKAEKIMYDERKRRYEKISRNVKIDRDSFDELVYQVDPETGLRSDKFEAFLKPEERNIITNANGTFADLHNELIPALTKRIASPNTPLATKEALQAIKDNILDDQLDLIASKNTPGRNKMVAEVEDARGYNQEYMDFFGKKAPLNGIRKANQDRGLIEANVGNESTAFKDTRKAVTEGILSGNENRERAGFLNNLFDRPDVNIPRKDILKYHITRSLDKSGIRDKLNAGTLTDLEANDFIKAFSQEASAIKNDFPQEFNQLQDFVKRWESGKGNLESLKKTAAEVEKAATTGKADIDNEMRQFYDDQGLEINSGKVVFGNIFDKPGTQQVKQLIERAKTTSNTETMDGIKAAYIDRVRIVPGQAHTGSDVAGNKVKDEINKNLEVADVLYEDQPEIPYALREAYKLMDLVKVNESPTQGTRLAGEIDTAAKDSVNKVITLMFGVLNPTATRIRTFSSMMTKDNSPNQAVLDVMGEFMSDPAYFKQVMERVNKVPMMSKQNRDLSLELLTRANVINGVTPKAWNAAWDELTLDDQTNNAFNEREIKPEASDLEKSAD